MKGKTFALVMICVTILSSFGDTNYLEWSPSSKLSFSDFKGVAPKGNSGAVVNLSTLITFETRQIKGKVPQITIYNRVDRDKSWIKTKKTEVLQIQQIKFDYSELYARKIRKNIAEYNKKGIVEKQKYVDMITKQVGLYEKSQRKKMVLLEDQPHLIKIMQKDVKDSLAVFKNYTK